MRHQVVLRSAAVVAAVISFVSMTVTPAAAHTISGPRPTNYRSHIVAIVPAAPGISARVVDLGAQFELTNRTTTEITVLGYEGEPYLRIGPQGVFENLHSQATYINRTRAGGSVPSDVDTAPAVAPQWKKVSSGHSARWHDHRIHWMSSQPPPPVAESPGRFYHLSQQNIVFLRGPDAQRVAIAVALDWVPGPSGLPWIPAIVVLFALGLVAAVVPRWWRLVAVLVGVVVVSDAAHALGFEIPRPGTNVAKVVQFLGGSFVSIAVWVAAVPTIVTLVRRRAEALYGVVFVGLLIALIGGVTDLSALWKSQIPDAGPAMLTRIEVVIALGAGGGLAIGALVRMMRSRAPVGTDGDGRWLSLLVEGLSDAELERIISELDADEVLGVALAQFARRAEPVAGAFASGAVAFAVDDVPQPATWSVAVGAGDRRNLLQAVRGGVTPQAASIRAPFALMLQMLAGTVPVATAVGRPNVTVTGDTTLIARIAPYLPETGGTDRAAPEEGSSVRRPAPETREPLS